MMPSRNFYRIAFSLIIFCLYQSCSSSFNPAAPYKTVTVVYGLLSVTDSIHYIKIERSFLSENSGNAYTEAQVGDSIYFPSGEITADLVVYDHGSPINTIPLTRVNADTLGQPKQPGIFADTPNIVYETKDKLNENYNYELVITNNKTGQTTTSTTTIVNTFTPLNPVEIDFTSSQYTKYSWSPAVNAALYQLVLYFRYEEINIANPGDTTHHYLMWVFPSETGTSFTIFGQGFFTFVASQIPVNPAVERRAQWCNLWYYAGGSALYTYQQVNIANSTSLVYGTVNPYYSDITNGVGLFSSSIVEQFNNLPISGGTIDNLACSIYTQQLNFLNSAGQLCSQ